MHQAHMWKKIIHLLISQGYSQRQLAEVTGVDQSTISRIAEGRLSNPRYSVGHALIELAGGSDALAAKHGIRFSHSESTRPVAAGQGVANV